MGARSLLLLVWLAAALTVYLCDVECLMGGPECHAEAGLTCTAPVCHLDDLQVTVAILLPPPPSAPAPLVSTFSWPSATPNCSPSQNAPRPRPRAPPAA